MKKKASFTEEEKQLILNKLNRKRIKTQKIEEPIKKEKLKEEIEKIKGINRPKKNHTRRYTQEEKEKIFARLNRDRLHKREKKANPIKQIHSIYGKNYYKFVDMPRDYYISVDATPHITARPIKMLLYYRVIDEIKKREVLIRSVSYSTNFFISISTTKRNFKEYRLEEVK